MNTELLNQPFLAEQVKQRQGNFGQTLDYLEGHTVIQRLNEAFGGDWSFEILEHQIREDANEVIVLGKLTAETVVKSQFGSSRLTRHKESGEMVSLADDLKAAATDSLKKCATLLGVGLYLYDRDRSAGERTKFGQGDTSPEPSRSTTSTTQPQARVVSARISQKQHAYILQMAKEADVRRQVLDAYCKEHFGVVLDHLTKHKASVLIDLMQKGHIDFSQHAA